MLLLNVQNIILATNGAFILTMGVILAEFNVLVAKNIHKNVTIKPGKE